MIDRDGDSIMLAMDCGGLVRARTMALRTFEAVVRGCEQIRDIVIRPAKKDAALVDDLPEFPECRRVAECKEVGGVCDIVVTASRNGRQPEFQTSLYDPDDQAAPALLLIDEQLDDFLSRAKELLPVGPASPGPAGTADSEKSSDRPSRASRDRGRRASPYSRSRRRRSGPR